MVQANANAEESSEKVIDPSEQELKELVRRLRDDFSVNTVVKAAREAADLIERQKKAIDLLLRAIGPLAELVDAVDGFHPDMVVDVDGVRVGDLRAARSAKEEAEKILHSTESKPQQ